MKRSRTKVARDKEPQVHPGGPLVTLSLDERREILEAREKKGLTQGELARKVGTTAGTISNIETGRKHGESKIPGQVRTVLLAKIRRALSIKADAEKESLEEKFKALVEEFADLDEREIDLVLGLIAGLKTQRASKPG